MAKRSPRPGDMPWLTPYLTVRDAGAALEFYRRAFGFEKKNAMTDPEGRVVHAEITYRDAVIMFGPEADRAGCKKAPVSNRVESGVILYVYVDDVDSLCAQAKAAGATVLAAPHDEYWGDRICTLADPDGHIWNFATNVADFDPSKAP